MLTVPGLRPEKVLRLYKDLGIASLADLEAAAKDDRIRKAKGLGAALQTKILQNLAIAKGGDRPASHASCRHPSAAGQGGPPKGRSRNSSEVTVAAISGGAASSSPISPWWQKRPRCQRRSWRCECVGPQGLRRRPQALWRRPPPCDRLAEHLEQLRALADKKGMRLDPEGLHRGRSVVAAKEADIYRALGLPFIEPELREGRGEIERALKGQLPKLVSDKDLHGILHCHTDSSDGTETLERMAKATRQRGFQYFGVADHSKSAHYAGGLTVEQIEEQHREADRLNKAFGKDFRILKGIESDILADGALDYPDDVLARFDFVVASIHGRFKLDRKTQTDRLLGAVSNRHTTILGHMTGRQLLRRPGYEIDVEKVLRACAKHDVAIEINAHPWRLDLDWRWHQAALGFGCMMSINPDAHSIPELDHMHWGVEMARKGGVPADRVLNAMSLGKLLLYLKRKRRALARAA